MINRRDFLGLSAGLGATLGPPRLLAALSRLPQGQLLRRAIPSTGEMIPVIGLGSSATFATVARAEDASALEAVSQAMVDRGARVFDTAPSYGASEQVSGDIVNQLGVADTLFWATKVNVAGRGGTAANPTAARAQTEKSFAILKRPTIGLIQVHNMGDPATQLPIVHEFKKAGRVRYVGITTTFSSQYAQLIDVMRNEPLDFFGVDYAADNRDVENVILPLAIDEKIAVLAYPPFGRTSLFRRAAGNELPAFAKEFDATTWAQFFLTFTLTHPAITAVTPATSQARIENSIEVGGVQAPVPCLERTGERASARPPPRRCASRAVRPAVRMGDPGPAGPRDR